MKYLTSLSRLQSLLVLHGYSLAGGTLCQVTAEETPIYTPTQEDLRLDQMAAKAQIWFERLDLGPSVFITALENWQVAGDHAVVRRFSITRPEDGVTCEMLAQVSFDAEGYIEKAQALPYKSESAQEMQEKP